MFVAVVPGVFNLVRFNLCENCYNSQSPSALRIWHLSVDQAVERVTQIGNDVSGLLDPHRETNHAIADTALGALFRSADIAWTFPQAFAAAPVVSGQSDDLDTWATSAARAVAFAPSCWRR